jgi:flavin-binding protein dodecin
MSIVKVIEVIASSKKSFDDATEQVKHPHVASSVGNGT